MGSFKSNPYKTGKSVIYGDSINDLHQLTGSLYVSGDITIADDRKLYLGTDKDASIEYDENGDDILIIQGAAEGTQIRGAVFVSGTLTTELDLGVSATDHDEIFSNDGIMEGEVIKLLNTTVVQTRLYYLNWNAGSPAWTLAQADSTPAGATGSLALAVNTNSFTHGMMQRGFVRLDAAAYDHTGGETNAQVGEPLYLSQHRAGYMNFQAPTGSGEMVRIMGYCLKKDGNDDILVYFNPSNDYVEIA